MKKIKLIFLSLYLVFAVSIFTQSIFAEAEPETVIVVNDDIFSLDVGNVYEHKLVTDEVTAIDGPSSIFLGNDTINGLPVPNDATIEILTSDLNCAPQTIGTFLADEVFHFNCSTEGEYEFTYKIIYNGVESSTATVRIYVGPANLVPTVEDHVFTIDQGSVLYIVSTTTTPIVTDPNNDPLSYSIVNTPSHGILQGLVPEDGLFLYIPNEEYYGQDSFSFTAYDGELTSNISNIIVDIIKTNQKPKLKLVGSSIISVLLGNPLVDQGATASDIEDGDISSRISTTTDFDTFTAGEYKIKYSVNDLDDTNPDQSVIYRTVNVIDPSTDIDNDGILNTDDIDMDGDGVLNIFDTDVDGDGVLDEDQDDDSDKNFDNNDLSPTGPGTLTDFDADGILNADDVDMDNDGIINIFDTDTDGDGVVNTDDTDDDSDGTLDTTDESVTGLGTNEDYDGDGILNTADTDLDGDGITNETDTDIDGDKIVNPDDADDDNDNIVDEEDKNPEVFGTTETDANQAPVITLIGSSTISILFGNTFIDTFGATASDLEDGDITSNITTINDINNLVSGTYSFTYRVEDSVKKPLVATLSRTILVVDPIADVDSDGKLNADDIDIDGDGILNIFDTDVDGDGVFNNDDGDDDSDKVEDGKDVSRTGLGTFTDFDGDGILNENDVDIDGDGVLNIFDTDTDGDGVLNTNDLDSDEDGIPDLIDLSSTGLGTLTDFDGDGIPNTSDTDLDGDGILNSVDTDTDGDGIVNTVDTDDDNDTILDSEDLFPSNFGTTATDDVKEVKTPVVNTSGGGGGGGGSIVIIPTQSVLNPTTTPIVTTTNPTTTVKTIGKVLGASLDTTSTSSLQTCGQYMNIKTFIGPGLNNNKVQVILLQKFLNKNLKLNIPTNGKYGPQTQNAVKAFQLKYKTSILTPWGETEPTSSVGYTTINWINYLNCPTGKFVILKSRLVPTSSSKLTSRQ